MSWLAWTSIERTVTLAAGEQLSYDYLIIATGVSAAFFGVPGAAEHSLSLYTRRDAIALRNTLMEALERRNEGLTDPELDVTVVGGGATGVELAGTLAELRNVALPAVYPQIDRSMFRVRLIEMGPALLAPYRDSLRRYTRQQLVDRGVEVLLSTAIKEVRAGSVLLADGSERRSDITVWAAGVSGPDADWTAGLPRGKGGRIEVEADLRVPGHDRVFAAGDIALNEAAPVAQLAQPAIQEGRHAGDQVARLIAGEPTKPFRYHDKGIMATIGRRSAVVRAARRPAPARDAGVAGLARPAPDLPAGQPEPVGHAREPVLAVPDLEPRRRRHPGRRRAGAGLTSGSSCPGPGHELRG